MSKRKRRKHRPRPAARAVPTGAGGARAPAGVGDVLLVAARVVCLVGLPALLLVSPTLSYMQSAGLVSENSLFEWNCVQALAAAVAMVWLAAVTLGAAPRVRVHRVDVALVGFFAVALIASLLVPYRFDPARRLKEMLAGVVFFIVVKNLFADERHQRLLVRTMMTMLAIFAVIGVVHYLWHVLRIEAVGAQGDVLRFIGASIDPDRVAWEKEFGVRATSVTGNPNFLAGSLIVLVPVGLAWLVLHKRPRMPRGVLAGGVFWALVTALLLGLASDASKRFGHVYRETQQELVARGISLSDDPALAERYDRVRKNLRRRADLAIAWTVAGTVGLVAVVWLWPFAGTATAVVLGFALLLFTNSWAGYSGFIIGMIVLALLIWVKKPARYRPDTAAMLGGALAVVLVGFFVIKALSGSYIIPPKEARTGGRSRQLLWDTVPRMVRARPLLGFGADNFMAYSNKYMSQVLPGPSRFEEVMVPDPDAFVRLAKQPAPRRVTLFPIADADPGAVSLLTRGRRLVTEKHALVFINNPGFIMRNPGRVHSMYMSALIDAGVVGLVAFVAIFVFFYTGTLKAWRRGEDSWRSVISLGSAAAIAAVVAMQTVDFPFRLPWSTCLIVSALAMPLAWQRGWDVRLRAKLPAAVRAGLVVVIVAAGVYVQVTNWRQVRTLQLSKAAQDEQGARGFPTREVIAAYERAAARRARDWSIYFGLPNMLLYRGELDAAADHLARLERIQPYHEKVHYLWGQYYRQRGDADRAIACYRRALELEPRYMQARVTLIDTLVEAVRLDEAKAAIAEAWLWEVESRVRFDAARHGSPFVKMAEGRRLIGAADLYWPWVMNAEATVRALEGDFDGARARWEEAKKRWHAEYPGAGASGAGLYDIYPVPPIFTRNPQVLAQTTPEQVRADQATWAKRFYGVNEYEAFKRLDDEYNAALAWGGLRRSGSPPILSRAEAARYAERVLVELGRRFDTQLLVTDGNEGREYHNRMGLLKLLTGNKNEAAAEFQLSAQGAGGYVARANLVVLQTGLPPRFIDEQEFVDIRSELRRSHAMRYAEPPANPLTPEEYVNALKSLVLRYGHYAPVGAAYAVALAEAGHSDAATATFDALQRLYPDDQPLEALRRRLGL